MDLGNYISTLDLPPSAGIPKATPSDYGADVAAGLGKLAKEAMDLDQVFRAQADDLQRAQDVSDLSLEAKKRTSDLNVSLEQNPDWQTHVERWNKGYSQIKADLLSRINDPAVKRTMIGQLGNSEIHEGLAARGRAREIFVDQQKAHLAGTLRTVKQVALDAQTPEAEAEALGIGIGTITTQGTHGVLTAVEADKAKHDFFQDYFIGKAKNRILKDPEGFLMEADNPEYRFIDPVRLINLKSEAATHANVLSNRQEKAFREESGNRLNTLLVGIGQGKVSRSDTEAVIGTRTLTDEHERTLLHAVDAMEKEGGRQSNQEQFGLWKEKIELASIRKDTKGLREYSRTIPGDESVVSKDRAALLATIDAKLTTLEDKIPGGYTQAMGVLEKHYGFSPLTSQYLKADSREPHFAAMKRIENAAYGIREDEKTGELKKVRPLAGWELINLSHKIIAEENAAEERRRAERKKPAAGAGGLQAIPFDNAYRRR
ncbi:MAG: hypothetical protein ACYC37_01945 [Desulfobacteria bacterium]